MSRLRTIGATAVLTSLAWVAGIAGWLVSRSPHDEPRLSVQSFVSPQPAATDVAPVRSFGADGRLIIPVQGVAAAALTDTFAQARAGGARVHDAIDIPAPRGTPVVSAAPGTVEKLYLSKDGGNTVYVRSADGTRLYYYAHLDQYADGLTEGRPVSAGEVLGTVGSTGNASPEAPHLHFALLQTTPAAKWSEQAPAVNPYPLLTGRGD